MKQAKEMRLSVPNMTCRSCAMHVTRALEDLDGVDDVQISLREAEVCVIYDPRTSGARHFIEAVAEEGYEAKELPAAPEKTRRRFG